MTAALALSALLSLAHACAPTVAPETLLSVVRAESGFDPLTIGLNTRPQRAIHPQTRDAAVREAKALLAQGSNFDLGLAQINVKNLGRLGLSIDAAFDPCRNLSAGARVLTEGYLAARPGAANDQAALLAALSTYNTGDAARGLRNGYVATVFRAAAHIVPAIGATDPPHPEKGDAVVLTGTPSTQVPRPQPPPLNVFARDPSAALVWNAQTFPLPSPPSAERLYPVRPGDPS